MAYPIYNNPSRKNRDASNIAGISGATLSAIAKIIRAIKEQKEGTIAINEAKRRELEAEMAKSSYLEQRTGTSKAPGDIGSNPVKRDAAVAEFGRESLNKNRGAIEKQGVDLDTGYTSTGVDMSKAKYTRTPGTFDFARNPVRVGSANEQSKENYREFNNPNVDTRDAETRAMDAGAQFARENQPTNTQMLPDVYRTLREIAPILAKKASGAELTPEESDLVSKNFPSAMETIRSSGMYNNEFREMEDVFNTISKGGELDLADQSKMVSSGAGGVPYGYSNLTPKPKASVAERFKDPEVTKTTWQNLLDDKVTTGYKIKEGLPFYAGLVIKEKDGTLSPNEKEYLEQMRAQHRAFQSTGRKSVFAQIIERYNTEN